MAQKTLDDFGLIMQGQTTIYDWIDGGLYASQLPPKVVKENE